MPTGLTKRLVSICCLLGAVCVLSVGVQAADAPAGGSVNETYGFAVWLFDQAEFYRAVTEFKRYQFLTQDTEADMRCEYAVAACYQHVREWARAVDSWRRVLANFPEDRVVVEAAYRMAECMLAQEDYDNAGQVLTQYLANAPADSDFLDDALFLQATILLSKSKYADAEKGLAEFASKYPESPLASAAKELARSACSLREMKRKTPEEAALLSMFVPGLGQSYAGRTGDAWTAFLVNAALGAFTVDRFNRGDQTAGYLLGLTWISFYGGNIYGAARAATEENQRRQEALVSEALGRVQNVVARTLGHPERLRPWPLPEGEQTRQPDQ